MPRNIIALLLLAITNSAFSAPAERAPSEKDNYEIEILVFEYPNARVDDDPGFDSRSAALMPGFSEALVPERSSSGNHKLAASEARLTQHGIRILLHERWTQSMDSKSAGKPRRLTAAGRGIDPVLDGSIKVYMNRYLHADVQLIFKDDQTSARTGARYYRLDEQRRLKSAEIHYFDHPRFGLLLLVSAPEKEKPAARP